MFGKQNLRGWTWGRGEGVLRDFLIPGGGVFSEKTHAHQVKRVCVNCYHYGHPQNELNNVLNSKKG